MRRWVCGAERPGVFGQGWNWIWAARRLRQFWAAQWSGLAAKVLQARHRQAFEFLRIAYGTITRETVSAAESCGELFLTGACVISAVAQNQTQHEQEHVLRLVHPASVSSIDCIGERTGSDNECAAKGHARSWAGPGGCGVPWRDGAGALPCLRAVRTAIGPGEAVCSAVCTAPFRTSPGLGQAQELA